jgi:hypothetical protein
MRSRPVYGLLALLLVGVALMRGVLATAGAGTPATAGAASALPGLLIGQAPWSRNTSLLGARLARLGLPALEREGTVLHTHQHLDLFVNGRHVTVPAGIGIDAAGLFISPIHTHDTTGIVHVESPVVRRFDLGELFGVWGVRFNRDCLGGYCSGNGKALRVYVNGRPRRGDPRDIALTPHEELAVVYGRAKGHGVRVPRSFAFPFGY